MVTCVMMTNDSLHGTFLQCTTACTDTLLPEYDKFMYTVYKLIYRDHFNLQSTVIKEKRWWTHMLLSSREYM